MGGGWPQSAPILERGDAAAAGRAHAAASPASSSPWRRSSSGARCSPHSARASRSAPSATTPTRPALPASGRRRHDGGRLLSGGLAGLAGAFEVAGLKGYLTPDLSPGFGYAGIVVAMLAGLNPLGVRARRHFRRRRVRRCRHHEPDARRAELHRRPHRRRCRSSACCVSGLFTRYRHAAGLERRDGGVLDILPLGELLGGGASASPRR